MSQLAGQRAFPRERVAKDRYSVLLVDDSDDDRLFMRRAIRSVSGLVLVGEVCDGESAIEYLSGHGPYTDREKHPFPDVVLLDLKMPRKTGHEVLQWLQTQQFSDLFVAVVSGSALPNDIARSLDLGADVYFRKSALREELEAMVAEITRMLNQT